MCTDNWMERFKVIEFLREAVQCNTVNPPGNEVKLASIMRETLQKHGIECQIAPQDGSRGNLFARLIGQKPGKRLVFSGHMDTVPIGAMPWEVPPFSGEIKDGKVYGRGTSDMKGGLVASMFALIYFHQEKIPFDGELVFIATYGEETGSEGAKRILQESKDFDFDAMIIGEPSNNEIISSHKGALWVEVGAMGKASHASMPDQGINAVEGLLSFAKSTKTLDEFSPLDDMLSRTTCAITKITGGTNINSIPDYCSLTMDIRIPPGKESGSILNQLHGIAATMSKAKGSPRITVKPIKILAPLKTRDDASIVIIIQDVLESLSGYRKKPGAAAYFTDGSVFTKTRGDIIIIGPGNPELAHQPNEYVEIEAIRKSIGIYVKAARKFLNQT